LKKAVRVPPALRLKNYRPQRVLSAVGLDPFAATDFNRDGWLDLVATDSMLLHVTGDPERLGK